ncbi:MAG: antibiotic biosynthesis monooxygenase [Phycisphaerales bacterium]
MASDGAVAFLRTDEEDPPVTVIRDIRVRAGHEELFERLMSVLMAEAVKQPGHLGATVVRPQMPGHSYRFIYKFDRRSNLERWHSSDLRAELAEPIAVLVEWDRFEKYPGLETWFNLPLAPSATHPPKWKTTLMSWGAIYPLVLGGSYVMKALSIPAPMPVQVLILTAVVVPLVSYVVAPWLGRVLHTWLYRGLDGAH